MTDPAARTSGQIESPNPIELFWEKNRRWVTFALVLAVVGIGANYGWTYLQKQERNALWSEVATATNLDRGYATDASAIDILSNPQMLQMVQGDPGRLRQFYQQMARTELVTGLQGDLLEADDAQLEKALKQAAGKPAEPLVLWTMAVRAVHKEEWDTATQRLDQLEQRFGNHFLCAKTSYPPQVRPEKDEDKSSKKKDEPKAGDPPKPPELKPAVPGSPVSMLRAQIAADRQFRAAHTDLYQAPEPDAEPVVVFKLASPIDEEIRIRFYRDRAPQHVEKFLHQVRQDFYNGQRIDQVERPGTLEGTANNATQFRFGLAASKENDRALWTAAQADPSTELQDFEDNDLSHFPGMVAAAAEGEGQTSAERVWINAKDAVQFDGERVIFGRVDDASLEIVEQICGMAFADVGMDDAGRGQIQQNVTIEKAWVEGEPDVPPAPPEPAPEEGETPPDSGNGEKK